MTYSTAHRPHGRSRSVLRIGGRAASTPLRNADRIAEHVLRYFQTSVAPSGTLPAEQLREDVTQLTRTCLELVTEMLDKREVPGPDQLGVVCEAATQWAHDGVPLSTVLRACHEGVRVAFGLVTAPAKAADVDELLIAGDLMLEMLNAIIAGASDAYVAEQLLVAKEQHSAAETLASALLSGRGSAALSRQAGVQVADSYQVVALSIPADNDVSITATVAARRRLRRLRAAIATVFSPHALAVLSATGGTLLVPLGEENAPIFEADTLAALTESAEVTLTATVVISGTEQIPESADQAHELLTLIHAGQRAPGLYHMSDLDIEFQLTRGGSVTRRIATILDPLRSYPELLDTVRAYLANDMNRQRTARRLYVHPNTVDHRLRRVAQLTTIDLATSTGICRAAIALLAYDHGRNDPGQT
ncbi:helix-turn-helix domain-containing protein [Nocardia sp. NBC_01377]|uniref:PucR family transcriptional regulator n=1 Tax=Nocardia sp. NBC_01377 TaxID=2903595 RepID=UPI003253B0CF